MGVTFGNKFAVVCHTEEGAAAVKEWVKSQVDPITNGLRLPEAYYYTTPVYGLKQFGSTVVFQSEGYGTYDTVAFTPVHEHINYFVSMVDSRQCQETNYVSTILHYDVWEAQDDPERTPGYHRNDPESLYEDREYCDWFEEPQYPEAYWELDSSDPKIEEYEEEFSKQSDLLWDKMVSTFTDYAKLPTNWQTA